MNLIEGKGIFLLLWARLVNIEKRLCHQAKKVKPNLCSENLQLFQFQECFPFAQSCHEIAKEDLNLILQTFAFQIPSLLRRTQTYGFKEVAGMAFHAKCLPLNSTTLIIAKLWLEQRDRCGYQFCPTLFLPCWICEFIIDSKCLYRSVQRIAQLRPRCGIATWFKPQTLAPWGRCRCWSPPVNHGKLHVPGPQPMPQTNLNYTPPKLHEKPFQPFCLKILNKLITSVSTVVYKSSEFRV